LTLYVIYFGIQLLVQRLWKFLGFEGSVEMSPFFAGMVALGVVLAAFSAEVWLGALNAIPEGAARGGFVAGPHPVSGPSGWWCSRNSCASPCPASATTGWCC